MATWFARGPRPGGGGRYRNGERPRRCPPRQRPPRPTNRARTGRSTVAAGGLRASLGHLAHAAGRGEVAAGGNRREPRPPVRPLGDTSIRGGAARGAVRPARRDDEVSRRRGRRAPGPRGRRHGRSRFAGRRTRRRGVRGQRPGCVRALRIRAGRHPRRDGRVARRRPEPGGQSGGSPRRGRALPRVPVRPSRHRQSG